MNHKIVLVFFLAGAVAWAQANIVQIEEFTFNLDELTTPIIVPDKFDKLEIQKVPVDRIVQGQEAAAKQFPYQVGIFLGKNGRIVSFCGGSLISRNTVLTAAHCLEGMTQAIVCLGCRDMNQRNEEGRQVVAVRDSQSLISHENWDTRRIRNDVAVVKLPTYVQYSEYIQPVGLAPPEWYRAQYDGSTTTVSGWGKRRDSDEGINSSLNYINVLVQQLRDCQSFYRRNVNYEISTAQICTDGSQGRSTCQGDSGGPLVVRGNGRPVQVGIVSFGINSCERRAPSVFTRVSSYYNWIASKL